MLYIKRRSVKSCHHGEDDGSNIHLRSTAPRKGSVYHKSGWVDRRHSWAGHRIDAPQLMG